MSFFNFFSIHNTLVHIPLGNMPYTMSYIEAIAAIFGLFCIWFASKGKIINYFFGLVNVVLFAIIFYQIQLYALLLLQVFFFAANLYGWYAWRYGSENGSPLHIRWLPSKNRLIILIFSLLSIVFVAFYIDPIFSVLAHTTHAGLNALGANLPPLHIAKATFPFWDAAIMVLSMVAQILMTRKFVENWWLWVFVNIISIGIYSAQGVYVLTLQYVVLCFLAFRGGLEWGDRAERKN